MRVIVADCSAEYSGRLNASLPLAKRVLLIKADSSLLIFSELGSYKPLNWMTAPCTIREIDPAAKSAQHSRESVAGGAVDGDSATHSPESVAAGEPEKVLRVSADKGSDILEVTLQHIYSDQTYDLGEDPGLIKDGEEVKDVPANLPKVTRAKNGEPSIDMNGQGSVDSLISQTLIKGNGAKLTDKNTVVVKYTGWLTNGKQFDSSWDRDSTIDADLFSDSSGQHQVIEGWQKGLVGQTVGSQVLLVIPPDQAYGDKEQGPIPANSTLVFVIDILAAY